ncbi:MAG: flagellar hook-basal body protein [Planctomycetes bacterium]|nr:flagellar hook-basal body protein [Planctomycetota bacterium]NOG53522.1 flagellar hook-basal body protein [Planctomycetota bacterium]
MNYGLYLSASGLLVNRHMQDVVSNNIANVNTVGFKPDMPIIRQREPERLEDNLSLDDPNRLLENLGGGSLLNPTVTLFRDGALRQTGNPLDLAVRGEGFFTLSSGATANSTRLRFTRDGAMSIDNNGMLVHSGSGMRVLDENDRPIEVDPTRGDVRIESDGSVKQGNTTVARIQLITIADLQAFEKEGANTFRLGNTEQNSRLPASGSISQGWLETSAVDPMQSLMELNRTTAAVSANAQMIRYQDELMNSAINRLGRFV